MSIFDQFADDYDNENDHADDSELIELKERLDAVLKENASRIRKEMADLERQRNAVEGLYEASVNAVADEDVDKLRELLGKAGAPSGARSRSKKTTAKATKAKADAKPKTKSTWKRTLETGRILIDGAKNNAKD